MEILGRTSDRGLAMSPIGVVVLLVPAMLTPGPPNPTAVIPAHPRTEADACAADDVESSADGFSPRAAGSAGIRTVWLPRDTDLQFAAWEVEGVGVEVVQKIGAEDQAGTAFRPSVVSLARDEYQGRLAEIHRTQSDAADDPFQDDRPMLRRTPDLTRRREPRIGFRPAQRTKS